MVCQREGLELLYVRCLIKKWLGRNIANVIMQRIFFICYENKVNVIMLCVDGQNIEPHMEACRIKNVPLLGSM
jgi:hypothetical protein